MTDDMHETYDVVVVGGGAAGLSGAVMLGRSRRSVLVIDDGRPRNARAAGVHGFLSREGISPAALLEAGRSEVRGYGGQVVSGRVSSAARDGAGFRVALDDGREVGARRLLLTTGLVDELPDVPGVAELWGRDVLHCPYCHGWEVRDRPLGILGSGPMAVHHALLFSQWTPDVILFLHTAPRPTAAEFRQLAARDIRVVEGEVACVEQADDRLSAVRLRAGSVISREALVVAPHFNARSELIDTLGLEVVPHPMGVGEYVASDATGLTSVPGVWVAGNVADLMAQVIGAAAAGGKAAAAINADLVFADVQDAVEMRQELISSSPTAGAGDLLISDRRP